MVKPIRLSEGVELNTARPAVALIRAAACHVRAGLNLLGAGARSPEGAARELGFRDPLVDVIIQRSATSAADTTTSGWAQQLAGMAIFDFIQSITSISAAAEVIGRSLKINMDGIAEHRVPGRVLNAAAAGQWVAEEMAAPVRQLSFTNAAILRPRKLSVMYPYSREQAESSNIEAIIRQTLGEASGLALDAKMFSADAASASAPAGLFAGTAPLTPVAGGGTAAMEGDLKNLFAALAGNGAGKTAVIVAALPQAVTLKASVGPKFDYDIIESTALAAGTVVALEVASLVSGFSPIPEFRTSKTASYHAEDTAPTDITGGSPSPAVPTRSAFQTDSILLRMDVMAAFGMRATGHVAWLSGATW